MLGAQPGDAMGNFAVLKKGQPVAISTQESDADAIWWVASQFSRAAKVNGLSQDFELFCLDGVKPRWIAEDWQQLTLWRRQALSDPRSTLIDPSRDY